MMEGKQDTTFIVAESDAHKIKKKKFNSPFKEPCRLLTIRGVYGGSDFLLVGNLSCKMKHVKSQYFWEKKIVYDI